MPAPDPRLVALREKKQRAGLTLSERLELVALEDAQARRESDEEVASHVTAPERVKARVTGRSAGEQICANIRVSLQAIATGDPERDSRAEESFWRAIREEYESKLIGPGEAQVLPMTKREALEWQTSQVMLFGQFKGQGIEDVPLPYLRAIDADETSEKFRRDLRRYLNSGIRDS